MTVQGVARRAERSDAAEYGARAGLVARGLVWLVIGVLAAKVALGDHARADKKGALSALRDQPLGEVLLVVLAVAFTAHAAFRLLEGTVGRRDEEHVALKRAWSLCRVVVYGFFAVSTVRFLVSGGGGEDAKKPTAAVLGWPAGRLLVGAVGLGLLVAGVVLVVRGVRQDLSDSVAHAPSWACRLGQAGLAGRGVAYALIGFFLVRAAWEFDPDRAKGLDASLKALAEAPFGPVLLLLTAGGLIAFAAWSFCEARWKRF